MLRRLIVFSLLLVGFLCLSQPATADGEFTTSTTVSYAISDNGTTTVTHSITLVNKLSAVYATGYTLTLDGYVPENVQAWDAKGPLTTSTSPSGSGAKVALTFNDQVVGTGGQLNFFIRYQQAGIVIHKGQIWEISIPNQTDSQKDESYKVQVQAPKSFGKVAYVSPQPYATQDTGDSIIFVFQKDQISTSRIVAAFGQFQVFDFDLSYSLTNTDNLSQNQQIALPPDTAYQHLIYQSLSPEPENVVQDLDGNWLATYSLKAKQTLQIKVKGSAQIFATPQTTGFLTASQKKTYLAPSDVWQTTDTKINALGMSLKTPQAIYNYVVSHLTYNYNRVKPDAKRLGAKAALDNPDSAICTEFTDLFIALARSAGIPAREVEGYAYTADSKLEPLSLVEDVLHAWPEYWDESTSTWIQVDPTWGNTTGGVDFFSKLDLNHFAFVIHGQSPYQPLPAGFYHLNGDQGRSVNVQFGSYKPSLSKPLTTDISPNSILQPPFFWQDGDLTLTNPNGESVDNISLADTDLIRPREDVPSRIPPFGHINIAISYHYPYFFPWSKNPDLSITISGKDQKLSLEKTKIERVQELTLVLFLSFISLLIFIIQLIRRRVSNETIAKK